jgi:hypothetical protein
MDLCLKKKQMDIFLQENGLARMVPYSSSVMANRAMTCKCLNEKSKLSLQIQVRSQFSSEMTLLHQPHIISNLMLKQSSSLNG